MGFFSRQTKGTLKYGASRRRVMSPAKQRSHTFVGPLKVAATPAQKQITEEFNAICQKLQPFLNNAPKDIKAKSLPVLDGLLGVYNLFILVKKIILFFVIGVIVFSFLVSLVKKFQSSAAETVTGTVSATIIDDIFTTSCTTLSFGEVKTQSGVGQITVSPTGSIKTLGEVKVDLQKAKASHCLVRGRANADYRIKVPDSLTFSASDSMDSADKNTNLVVNNIQVVSSHIGSSLLTGRINSKGEDRLSIGATIYITENTAPGLYEGFIPVTVYY